MRLLLRTAAVAAIASTRYPSRCDAFVSPRQVRSFPTHAPPPALQKRARCLPPASPGVSPATAITPLASSRASDALAPGIAAIDAALPTLVPLLAELRSLPYFRLYSCDMLASCEYVPQELFECYTESCEIYPVDDDEVPNDIKSSDFKEHDFELDGWARWDMPSEDYYDTLLFPEDYTGYDGAEVWKFIHDRIGFHDGAVSDDEYDADDWKADFNKAVSGLHSMVSAQIVKGMQEKIAGGGALDPEAYPWTDPAAEYARRLGPEGETPAAVENLYFTLMLLLSGVRAARERLLADCAAMSVGGAEACGVVQTLLAHPLLDDPAIEVASRSMREHASKDSNNLWEARMRTRDLMRIMNCVQCNKCRFHGKISTLGLSTALQLAVGHRGAGGDPARIHRVELAALLTALGKFAGGLDLCLEMRAGSE